MPGLMKKPPMDDEEAVQTVEGSAQTVDPEATKARVPAGPAKAGNLHDKIVRNGIKLLLDKKTVPALVQMLDGDGNPVGGLMGALGHVMARLVDSAADNGIETPPDVLMSAAGALVQKLADFSAQSGGHQYTPEELGQVGQAFLGVLQGGGEQAAPAAPAAAPPPRRGLGA